MTESAEHAEQAALLLRAAAMHAEAAAHVTRLVADLKRQRENASPDYRVLIDAMLADPIAKIYGKREDGSVPLPPGVKDPALDALWAPANGPVMLRARAAELAKQAREALDKSAGVFPVEIHITDDGARLPYPPPPPVPSGAAAAFYRERQGNWT